VFHNLLISRKLQKERELPFADLRQFSPIFADFGRIFSHRFSHGIGVNPSGETNQISTHAFLRPKL